MCACVCVCVCLCLCPRPAAAVAAPFAQWNGDQVCGWLQGAGLGQYVAQGQEWIRSGNTLLQATQGDLEKVGGGRPKEMIKSSIGIHLNAN